MENIDMDNIIKNHISDSVNVKKVILDDNNLISTISDVSRLAINAYKSGNKLLIAGNGGSAGDAQHIAGELVNKFYYNRPGLPAIALSTDTSILSAIGNDYGFDYVFSRQIQANGAPGDIFIGISTSGNSKNILNAIDECRKKDIITVGLTGRSGGAMSQRCDYCIKVPSDVTPRIQEAHIMIGHIICAIVEETLFGIGV